MDKIGKYNDKKFVKAVKVNKFSWKKEFNTRESEKDEKIIEILLNELDIREERLNNLVGRLYELDYIFKNTEDSNKDKRNYEKVMKSGEVYEEVDRLIEEIRDVLIYVKDIACEDTLSIIKNISNTVANLRFSVKERKDYERRAQIMWERNGNFMMFLYNYSKIWSDRFAVKYVDLLRELGRLNEMLNETSKVEKSNLTIEEKNDIKEKIPNYKRLTSNRNMEKYLVDNGYIYSGTGRHDNYKNENGHKIPLPCHSKDMGIGLTKAIIKESKMGVYK